MPSTAYTTPHDVSNCTSRSSTASSGCTPVAAALLGDTAVFIVTCWSSNVSFRRRWEVIIIGGQAIPDRNRLNHPVTNCRASTFVVVHGPSVMTHCSDVAGLQDSVRILVPA